jgi:uncharacterized protein YcgI (DUF1989 family)
MSQPKIILDEVVPARQPWGARIAANDVLTIIDLEGQQAVDFLCYDGANPQDRYSVSNVNWFMSVPVLADGSAGVAAAALKPGSRVALRAERDVLAVLSNCPQMHNPCNGYNPTPIRVTVTRASRPNK